MYAPTRLGDVQTLYKDAFRSPHDKLKGVAQAIGLFTEQLVNTQVVRRPFVTLNKNVVEL